MIPLCVPYLGDNERALVDECIRTNQVSSTGPFVERFEHEFAQYVGSKYAVAVSSGTAALHLAVRLAGVERGDEVLVSTFSFVASANPVLYQGGRPVFVDSEPHTWNMDPNLVVQEIDRRAKAPEKMPKAVVVAHLYGHPANLIPITEICAHFRIPVIEDAAESLGATIDGRHVGTIGHMGCFSFNGNKIITTGGGGMLVTNDEKLAARARHLSRQARKPGPDYEHDEVGYNYRMTNIAAALGVAQLQRLPEFLAAKRRMARYYDRALPEVVRLPPRASWADPTFWLYCVRTLLPEVTRPYLAERGIESRRVWRPMHSMEPYCRYPVLGGHEAETLSERGLSLPSSVSITPGEQALVVDALKSHLTRTAA